MAFLEGEAVELVPLDPEDDAHVEAYLRTRNEPAMRETGYYGECLTPADAREAIEARRDSEVANALCAVEVGAEVVGWAGAWMGDDRARAVEVAYYVLPEHQGNGYATEAADLLVGFAFDELNAHSVLAKVQADNAASERVLEKLGFEQVGRQRDNFYKEGEYRDVTVWDLLEGEYRSRAGRSG